MRKIALVNQKGGVAKTTTTINLAAALVKLKRKVCVIDMDPQAHLTLGLGYKNVEKSVFDLLKQEVELEDVLINRKGGLVVLPSSKRLAEAESYFATKIAKEMLLKICLERLEGADYVLIDSTPSLGFLTINSLCYASEILVPSGSEFLTIEGVSQLVKTVEEIKKTINPKLEITGVFPTMYDSRSKLAKEVAEMIKGHFKKKMYKTKIRRNVSLAESVSMGKTIFEYAPKSNGAKDYLALAKEVIKSE